MRCRTLGLGAFEIDMMLRAEHDARPFVLHGSREGYFREDVRLSAAIAMTIPATSVTIAENVTRGAARSFVAAMVLSFDAALSVPFDSWEGLPGPLGVWFGVSAVSPGFVLG